MRISFEDIKILGASTLGVSNHFVEQLDIGAKLLISLVMLTYVSIKLYRLIREVK